MGVIKHKHHYLPVFYLNGFTPSGRAKDWVMAHDLESGEVRRQRPNAVGYEKNLYGYDRPGRSPNTIEDALAVHADGPGALAIQRLISHGLPISQHDYLVLMRFVASLAVRVPYIRNQQASFIRQAEPMVRATVVGTPEYFQALLGKMEMIGVRLADGTDVEALRQQILHDPGLYCDHNWMMERMLEFADMLTSMLVARSWVLFVANDRAGSFITSDNPVRTVWPDREEVYAEGGYARGDVAVSIALTRRMALVSQPGGSPSLVQRIEADRKTVALINDGTAAFAERHLYTSGPDWPIELPDHTIGGWPEYLKARWALAAPGEADNQR